MTERGGELRYSYSPFKLALIFLGIGWLGISGFLIFIGTLGPSDLPLFIRIIMGCAFVLCAYGALHLVWTIVSTKGAVVTITETGIRDIRVAPEEIPWIIVSFAAIRSLNSVKFIVLGVDPDLIPYLTLTRAFHRSRWPTQHLPVYEISIQTFPLNVGCEQLKDICNVRAKAVRQSVFDAAEALELPKYERQMVFVRRVNRLMKQHFKNQKARG